MQDLGVQWGAGQAVTLNSSTPTGTSENDSRWHLPSPESSPGVLSLGEEGRGQEVDSSHTGEGLESY